MIGALVAAVEEFAGWVDGEAAWVVAARPFVGDVGERAVFADGENADAVVEPVARIDEAPVGGYENFRAEIAARISRREAGDGLS